MSEKSQASSFRVPTLKASEYPVWKERMIIFLDSVDPEYLDRIYDGPHKPTKLYVVVGEEQQRMISKDKKDYNREDKLMLLMILDEFIEFKVLNAWNSIM